MKRIIFLASLVLFLTSCLNNDFMEVYPKDKQTEVTVFTNYDNFKTYSWGLYNVFLDMPMKQGRLMKYSEVTMKRII